MLLDPNEVRLMEHFGIRHVLVLRKVAEDDFGNYSCSAENHLGKSRAFIEVSGMMMMSHWGKKCEKKCNNTV